MILDLGTCARYCSGLNMILGLILLRYEYDFRFWYLYKILLRFEYDFRFGYLYKILLRFEYDFILNWTRQTFSEFKE